MAVLLLDQATVRPVRVLPAASFSVATNRTVSPTRRLDVAGLSVTEATGARAAAVVAPATPDNEPKTAL